MGLHCQISGWGHHGNRHSLESPRTVVRSHLETYPLDSTDCFCSVFSSPRATSSKGVISQPGPGCTVSIHQGDTAQRSGLAVKVSDCIHSRLAAWTLGLYLLASLCTGSGAQKKQSLFLVVGEVDFTSDVESVACGLCLPSIHHSFLFQARLLQLPLRCTN